MCLPYSGAGGWSPSDSDHYQWLQVNFGNRKQISAIATQGRYSSSDWVTQYRMLYSDTGRNWKPYHQDGNIWVSHCQKKTLSLQIFENGSGFWCVLWLKSSYLTPPIPGTVWGRAWEWSDCRLILLFLFPCVCVLWYLLREKRNVSKAKEDGKMKPNPVCPTLLHPKPFLSDENPLSCKVNAMGVSFPNLWCISQTIRPPNKTGLKPEKKN